MLKTTRFPVSPPPTKEVPGDLPVHRNEKQIVPGHEELLPTLK